MPVFVAELFSHRIRTTNIAIVHNLTSAVFGGLLLMICAWIANETGSSFPHDT
jgi:MFS transporter, MHS family, proline/betaine transporter